MTDQTREPMYLLVSIPPWLRGRRYASADKSSLQNRVIRSWITTGFIPLSVNTRAELQEHPLHAQELAQAGVRVLPVAAPPKPYPDYLPNLLDSLQVCIDTFPDSLIAITNADIYITICQSEISSLLQNHRSCILAHRWEVDTVEHDKSHPSEQPLVSLHPSTNVYGIDFVAAKASSFRDSIPFLSKEMAFGLPWWDLYVPLALAASNHQILHIDPSRFLHQRHEDRWDSFWWNKIGKHATRHFYATIKRLQAPPTMRMWINTYKELYSPHQTIRTAFYLLKCRAKAIAYYSSYKKQLDPRIGQLTEETKKIIFSPTVIDSLKRSA